MRLGQLCCRFCSWRSRGWRAPTLSSSTLDSCSQPFPLCTLEDAVLAANTQLPQGGCPAGTGNFDTIDFIVTGTIFPDNTLLINNSSEDLLIEGPAYGGITINGLFNIELIDAEDTLLLLENLTLTKGISGAGGGVLANGSEVEINNCTLVEDEALEGGHSLPRILSYFSSTTPLLEIKLSWAGVSSTPTRK
jgi:hypothetical protein